jgi:hypothetical protein
VADLLPRDRWGLSRWLPLAARAGLQATPRDGVQRGPG